MATLPKGQGVFLPPFKAWLASNIPAVYDNTMTYYEELVALIKYLQDIVVPAVNDNASAVTTISNAVEQLQSYVENYFANLDVQEEINNKLDQMADDGILQEIITTYIQSNIAWTFDTVSDMQSATNFITGSYAKTYGFYALNDKGGAEYLIREPAENETANNITTFDIVGSLIAELVIMPSMNVKQFGAKGDNTADDTSAIQTALNSVKNLEFTNDTYKVVYVDFQDNQTIEGNGAKLNCLLNTANLIAFGSHLTIKNIEIHSLNNDREWNRLDLRDEEFITFENCTFSGFQQQEIVPPSVGLNCWALYIRECHDIRVVNCKFVDNNFQDVLIEFSNYNIYFENCSGSYNNSEGMIIDIEPSANTGINENIVITNCIMREFDIYEYFNNFTSNKNITLNNCTISNLRYVGGDVQFNNCIIKSFSNKQSVNFLNSDGVVSFNDSLNFSPNLIADPYFQTLSYTSDANRLWHVNYANTAWKTLVYRIKDSEGTYLALNPTNIASGNIILETKQISASAGDVFVLKHISKAFYPTGSYGATANHINIKFYRSNNDLIDTYKLKTNRGAYNTAQKFSERTNVFMCPEGTSYFIINLRNGEVSSANAAYFKSLGLYKVTCDQDRTNNIESLGDSEGKPFYGSILFNSENNDINHFAGERMYYNAPSTYIGGVCTNATNNTWKEFGSLAS